MLQCEHAVGTDFTSICFGCILVPETGALPAEGSGALYLFLLKQVACRGLSALMFPVEAVVVSSTLNPLNLEKHVFF